MHNNNKNAPRRLFTAAVLLLCYAPCTHADAATNLIQNGAFSQGMTGWTAGSSLRENVVEPASGGVKLLIAKTQDKGNVRIYQPGITITKGRNYVLSFKFRSTPNQQDAALYMTTVLRPHEGDYVPLGLAKKIALASYPSDVTITLPFTALESSRNARIGFSIRNIDIGNVILDDIELTEGGKGDISASDWKGTSHERLDNVIPYIKSAMKLKWYYNWTPLNDNSPRIPTDDSILSDPQFVPMIWCKLNYTDGNPDRPRNLPEAQTLAHLERQAAIIPDRPWLLFNEPDNGGQCGATLRQPEDVAAYYTKYYDAIMRGSQNKARIFVGGTMYSPLVTGRTGLGYDWWKRFANAVERPIMGVHIHAYGHNPAENSEGCRIGPDHFQPSPSSVKQTAECWIRELKKINTLFRTDPILSAKIPVKTSDLIWITETGILTSKQLTPQTVVRDNWMKPIAAFWQNRPYGLGRLAWFTDFDRPRCHHNGAMIWSTSANDLINVQHPTQSCPEPKGLAQPIINPSPLDVSLSPLGTEWSKY